MKLGTVGMVVATAAWVIALPFAGMAAMFSPMIFDSGESPMLWAMFVFIVLAPVILLAAIAAGWAFWALGQRRPAALVMAAPALWLALAAGTYVLMGGK